MCQHVSAVFRIPYRPSCTALRSGFRLLGGSRMPEPPRSSVGVHSVLTREDLSIREHAPAGRPVRRRPRHGRRSPRSRSEQLQTARAFESPNPFNVLVFEEGAVLTAHTVRVNGNLVFSHAVTGRAQNTLTQTTCTFTVGSGRGAGSVFEVTGILNTR